MSEMYQCPVCGYHVPWEDTSEWWQTGDRVCDYCRSELAFEHGPDPGEEFVKEDAA